MHVSSRRPAHLRRLLATTATVGLLVLGGCSAANPAVAPAPLSIGVAAIPPATQPGRTDLDCIDRTGSLPAWFTQRALGYVADQIEAAVAGPMSPARFYVRSTSSTSYSPDAEITTVRLDAVPTPPSAPTPSSNPYLRQQNEKQDATYRAQLASWTTSLDAARAVAHQRAEQLRGMTLAVDTAGTDVLGCPLRAVDLLDGPGERHLFLASDLVPTGPQQDVGLPAGSLSGVAVTIAFYCRDPAGICTSRLDGFRDQLRQAGATDTAVLDPQDMDQ